MATGVTTRSNFQTAIQQQYVNKLLATPFPQLIHTAPADMTTLDSNDGYIARFRRLNRLAPALAPIVGVIDKAPQRPTQVYVDAKLQLYGDLIMVESVAVLTDQDPILNSFTNLLGLQVRETEDILMRDKYMSSAGFVNCTAGSNGDTPTEPTRPDFDKAATILRYAMAEEISPGQIGEDRFGTSPLRPSFLAMCNVQLEPSFTQGVYGFKTVDQYPNPDLAYGRAEFGSVGFFRVLTSRIGAQTLNASAMGRTVYDIILAGKGGAGVVNIEKGGVNYIYRDAVTSSALALFSTIGWTMMSANVIKNDQWILRLRATTQYA